MVTCDDSPDTRAGLLGPADHLLTLRVRGPEHTNRVLRLRSTKCVIGSHPHCTLRLLADGVDPVHCMILRGASGTYIRRWSARTTLNGGAFTDARLDPGDLLAIGPIELEVLAPTSHTKRQERKQTIPPRSKPAPQTRPTNPSGKAETQAAIAEAVEAGQATLRKQIDALNAELSEHKRAQESHAEQRQQEIGSLQEQLRTAQGKCSHLLDERQMADDRHRAEQSEHRTLIEELRAQLHTAQEQNQRQSEGIDRVASEVDQSDKEIATLRDQLTELRGQLDDQHQRREDAQLASQLADARQQVEDLQQELGQTREAHREASTEWHSDRRVLEQALAARTESLEQTEEHHCQSMAEAEEQIHSLQHEGKKLLLQLEESRQSLRETTAARKKLESVLGTNRAADHVPASQTMFMPGSNPQAEPQHDHQRVAPPSPPFEKTNAQPLIEERSDQHTQGASPVIPDFQPQLPQANDATSNSDNPENHTLAVPADQLVVHAPDGTTGQSGGSEPDVENGEIQEYMARLLARVGSKSSDPTKAAHNSAPSTLVDESARSDRQAGGTEQDHSEGTGETASSRTDGQAGSDSASLVSTTQPEGQGETSSSNAYEPRSLAPEMAADLLKMRELANATARTAIKKSEQNRDYTAATGGLVVSVVCLVTSVFVIQMSPGFRSAQMVGGVLGACLGSYWMVCSVRSLLLGRRNRRHAGSAESDDKDRNTQTLSD